MEEKATACHSERSEESLHLKAQSVRKNAGILRGVYPERQSEMLRFAQHDSERAQNDRQWGYPPRMTDIAYESIGWGDRFELRRDRPRSKRKPPTARA